MAKKYKISESNFSKFFGLFGSKDKPKLIQQLINNDPTLISLDKKITDLNKQAANSIKKNPRVLDAFKRAGWDIS
jgi:hypothetical protein